MSYDADDEIPEPPAVRRLRIMVSVLMVVLILGIVTIAATIVIRLGFGIGEGSGAIAAAEFELPAGDVLSLGQGDGTALFLLRDGDGKEWMLVFDDRTGEQLSRTQIQRN
ncbi:MAG: DUF6476 family protein [Pseudomonadota bacterium]